MITLFMWTSVLESNYSASVGRNCYILGECILHSFFMRMNKRLLLSA